MLILLVTVITIIPGKALFDLEPRSCPPKRGGVRDTNSNTLHNYFSFNFLSGKFLGRATWRSVLTSLHTNTADGEERQMV